MFVQSSCLDKSDLRGLKSLGGKLEGARAHGGRQTENRAWTDDAVDDIASVFVRGERAKRPRSQQVNAGAENGLAKYEVSYLGVKAACEGIEGGKEFRRSLERSAAA